mmetsp:Transcript_17295/g.12357  ORF Transcript_17295/g.12357 Transcript_17295/m.12357 type:complete len:114 (+) Transcript_17295:1516-1857(+)
MIILICCALMPLLKALIIIREMCRRIREYKQDKPEPTLPIFELPKKEKKVALEEEKEEEEEAEEEPEEETPKEETSEELPSPEETPEEEEPEDETEEQEQEEEEEKEADIDIG